MYLRINDILWLVTFFIVGAIFGSFFNVCIYRIPRKKSIISPRSHCPMCGHTIPWYDNIPIISYILLKGKCRFCGATIPVRYLIVELLAACLFPINLYIFGIGLELLVVLVLLSLLTIVAFIDIETGLIPNVIVLPGMVLGIGLSSLQGKTMESILGLLTGGMVLYILTALSNVILKKEAMGGGDIKLLAMIGAYMGWFYTLIVLFGASLLGVIFALPLRKRKIVFGPFLAVATLITIIIKHFKLIG